jgi:hypothetical protein
LLTGIPIVYAAPRGGSELMVQPKDRSNLIPFTSLSNVFKKSKEAGHTTTAVGWTHPYCRLMKNDLDHCSWQPVFQTVAGSVSREDKNLLRSMHDQIHAISPLNNRRLAMHAYLETLEDAKNALAKPEGLMLLHFPVPHGPPIYDRQKRKFSLTQFSQTRGYFDNLVLTDQTFGELRRFMEEDGAWNRSVVIVSSDHPWRSAELYDGRSDPYVPFFLKMPEQSRGQLIDAEFETVQTADLVLAILRDKIRSSSDAITWIREHSRPHPN